MSFLSANTDQNIFCINLLTSACHHFSNLTGKIYGWLKTDTPSYNISPMDMRSI